MKIRQLVLIAACSTAIFAVPNKANAQQAIRVPLAQAGVSGVATTAPMWKTADTFEFIAAGPALEGEVVKDSPYSAEAVTETEQPLADGNKISRTSSSKIYRDREGRTRREQQIDALGPWSSAGDPKEIVFINDPVAGVNYVLNPNERTAQKMEVHLRTMVFESGEGNADEPGLHAEGGPDVTAPGQPAQGAVFLRQIESDVKDDGSGKSRDVTFVHSAIGGSFHMTEDNAKTESLGTRVIEGVEAEGMRSTTTIPAGQIGNQLPLEIVSESWFSAQLQTTVLSKHSDPRMGQTTYRLTNIQLVEPLPAMFEVPADYTVQQGPNSNHFEYRQRVHDGNESSPAK